MSHTCCFMKVGSSLFRIGKGPAACAALAAAGFGCLRRRSCAAVTDLPVTDSVRLGRGRAARRDSLAARDVRQLSSLKSLASANWGIIIPNYFYLN
jgi:hypothetical protein